MSNADPGLWREALYECLVRADRYMAIAAIHVELGDDIATESALKSLIACVRTSAEIFREYGPSTSSAEATCTK
jgi:hypothetical protein